MINLLYGVKTREYKSFFLIIGAVLVACFFFGPTGLYAGDPNPKPYLSVEPSDRPVAAGSGTTSFQVSTNGGTQGGWTPEVLSGGDWLTISKRDDYNIDCSYKANSSNVVRTGKIRVTATDKGLMYSPLTVTVTQAGQTSTPVLSVSPYNNGVGKDAGSTTFSVTNAGTGSMSWTAQVVSGSWLSIVGGASGTNSGTITCSFGANTDTSSRTGTIRVTASGASGNPKEVTVTQEGQPQPVQPVLSVTPDNSPVGKDAGTTTFNVANTGTGSMSWTAQITSGSEWLWIPLGTSGTNSGTIPCSFFANSSTSSRTGTILVTASGATGSPKEVKVTQAGQSPQPVLSVTPDNSPVGKDADTTTFNVANTGTGSMSWTVQITSGIDWLSIKPGTIGTDSGTIPCSFFANSSTSSRTGTILVTALGATGSPKEVKVTQAGQSPQPVLSVSPTTLTVGMDPNYTTSMVTNYSRVLVSNTGTGNLNWTAQVTSGGDWLQIRSGASGTNSGEVNVGFLSNTSVAARTGAIRITASGASGSPVDISVSQVGHLPMTIRVPDTGQTKCYDVAGNVITCPSSGQSLYGQDGNYSINPRSYTKLNAYGNDLPDSATTWYMVRDNVTRLTWEMKNNKDGKADYSNPHDADNTYTWYDSNPATNGGNAGTQSAGKDTESFLKALNDSSYGGYNDWRLPTIKELAYIVDNNIPYPGPTINTTYFPNTAASWYWSSTTGAYGTNGAWSVDFYDGGVGYYGKDGSDYVRAVRGGQ
jgi:hypothetical protein